MTSLIKAKGQDGKPFFSEHRAISSMCGFLNGACDTTHATIYWLCYHLAVYPEIQQRLKQQVRSVLGSRKDFSVEEARSMPLFDGFLKESMRYIPTVPVNQRCNIFEDIDVLGTKVPRNTNVNIPMSVMFRDERSFGADTDKFIPERFMGDSKAAKTARRNFSAFGQYSRMCIGATFAIAELKAILIVLLQGY